MSLIYLVEHGRRKYIVDENSLDEILSECKSQFGSSEPIVRKLKDLDIQGWEEL
jgi:hypothetical protein